VSDRPPNLPLYVPPAQRDLADREVAQRVNWLLEQVEVLKKAQTP